MQCFLLLSVYLIHISTCLGANWTMKSRGVRPRPIERREFGSRIVERANKSPGPAMPKRLELREGMKNGLIVSHVRNCSLTEQITVQNAIIDVVEMLDTAYLRLQELEKYLALSKIPPIQEQTDLNLVSTFRLYTTLISGALQISEYPFFRARISSQVELSLLMRSVASMSTDIQNPKSLISKATEIYCDTSWIKNEKLDTGNIEILLDDRRSAEKKPKNERIIPPPKGIRPYSDATFLALVPCTVWKKLAGNFSSVISLNPRMMKEDWNPTYRSVGAFPKLYFSDLRNKRTEDDPALPQHISHWFKNYLAPNLLLSFTQTPTIRSAASLTGRMCLSGPDLSVWECLLEIGQDRRGHASTNQQSFTYLVLGLFLSSGDYDWSTGLQRPIKQARDG